MNIPDTIPATIGGLLAPPAPGTPGSLGWEVRVLSGSDFATLMAIIPRFESLQFSAMLNDQGSGTVVMARDDVIFTPSTFYPGSYVATVAGSAGLNTAMLLEAADAGYLQNGQTFTWSTGANAGPTVYTVTGISLANVPAAQVGSQLEVTFTPSAANIPAGNDTFVVGSYPGTGLFDRETLWQVWHDGALVFDFMCETVTEALVGQDEQRVLTVTGPGTAAALGWAATMPPGWPYPIYRTDGIKDPFDEVNASGQLTLDTALWNLTSSSPAGAVVIDPSGSVQVTAGPTSPVLGGGPFSFTTISAQITPVAIVGGGTLDGSQLTQFYVQATDGTGGYAMIGLSGAGMYAQVKDAEGNTFTKTFGAYNSTSMAYWRIQYNAAAVALTFDTSPDGTTWTQQWIFAVQHMWNYQRVDVYFTAKYDVVGPIALISNLNNDVLFPTSLGPIFIQQPIMADWLTLLQAAQGRGTIPWVAPTFNGTNDSGQQFWQDSQSVQIPIGTDLYTLLTNSVGAVGGDWRMRPSGQLDAGIPGSVGRNLQSTIVFHDGGQNMVRQDVRARNSIANMVAAQDEAGFIWTQISNQSISKWQQREQFITAASSLDGPTTSLIAGASLAQQDNEVPSRTLQIAPNVPGKTIFRDFMQGDWVGLEHSDFRFIEPVRVVAVGVQVNADGSEVHELTLMTYVQWIEEQLSELVNELGGSFAATLGALPPGTSVWGGGSIFPARVTPVTSQTVAPSVNSLADVIPVVGGLMPVPGQALSLNPDGQTYSIGPVQGGAIAPGSIPNAALSPSITALMGGAHVTIGSTAPSSPVNGDLWFNAGNGYALYQYESGVWTPYPFSTGAIAAAAITATQLAAGIIYAGIVDTTAISSADFLEYAGAPAAGSLVGSWSDTGGTDSFGNPYGGGLNLQSPQQITFTGPDGSVLSLIPAAQEQISLTSAITGIYQTALAMATTDSNQVAPAHLSAVLMNAGAASQQMASLLHSPNQGSGSGMLMLSQSDDGTLPPTILFCLVTSGNNVDLITPIALFSPYAFLLYSGASGSVVVTKTSGSGTIAIPSGVTTAKAECMAGGGGGGNGNSQCNGGGGGAEYAQEPSLAVTGGGTVSYAVGAYGGGGAQNNSGNPANGANGANSTITGTSATVTAHGGQGAGQGSPNWGAGGSGSTNTIHYPGGNGGLGLGGHADDGGGGGGSSAGTGAAGRGGGAGTTGAGGAGGVAPTGGGSGGQGGAPPSNGGIKAGYNYGGGGGGGCYHNALGIAYAGYGGAPGYIRLSYSTGTPQIMFSVASASGTDPYGTAYAAGARWISAADNNTYLMGKKRVHGTATLVVNTTGQVLAPGLTMNIQPGNYAFEAWVPFTPDTSTYAAYVTMGGTATTTVGGFVANLTYTWNSGAISYVQTTFNNNSGMNTGALATGRTYIAHLKGRIVCQGAGTLEVHCATSGGDGYTVQLGGILELEPD